MIILGKLMYLDKNWLHCRVTISVGANKKTSAIQVIFFKIPLMYDRNF